MAQHTPGPWQNNGGRIEAEGAGTSDAVVIATVGTVNDQTPQNTADAKLVAQAPALLRELTLVLQAIPDRNYAVLASARQVIQDVA